MKISDVNWKQQSFISIGNIVIQGVINGFGAGAIASYSAAIKLNNLVITSFTTLGNEISNYTTQNVCVDILERVRMDDCHGIVCTFLPAWTMGMEENSLDNMS